MSTPRVQVTLDNHHLGPVLPSPSDSAESFAHVDASGPSQIGAVTHRQGCHAIEVYLEKDFDETILAKDASDDAEESETDRNISDLNAKLGGDEDTASDWDPTDYGRPPDNLILHVDCFEFIRLVDTQQIQTTEVQLLTTSNGSDNPVQRHLAGSCHSQMASGSQGALDRCTDTP
jgi:hypothetical protein